MSSKYTLFVGADTKIPHGKVKEKKKSFSSNKPPSKLAEKLVRRAGFETVSPETHRIADVSLVGNLEKNPIPENINLANRGKVTNRILFSLLKKPSTYIYDELGKPHWLIESDHNPAYRKSVAEKKEIQIQVLVLLHRLSSARRELSIFYEPDDLDSKGIESSFISNVYRAFLYDQNKILMGNVFNTEKIGCFQLYTIKLVHCSDCPHNFHISKIHQAANSVYDRKHIIAMLSDLIPQMLKKVTVRKGADKFLRSHGFYRLPVPDDMEKKTSWKVKVSDRMYYLLTTQSIPEYARPQFREIMKKFGYKDIGSNAKYLPYKLMTPEGTAPSAREFTEGFIYGPSSSAYGEQGDSYFTEDQTDWPWITTMRAVFQTLTDKKDLYNFIAEFVPKAIPQLDSGPSDVENTVMPYSVILETGDKNTFESIINHKQSNKGLMKSRGKTVKQVLKEQVFKLKQYDWIFKPTMGAQGKGIFVQYRLQPGDDEDKIIENIVHTIVKEREKEPEYKEWVIAQFLSRPLLFTPFKMDKQITSFYQKTNPEQYTDKLIKRNAKFSKQHFKLSAEKSSDLTTIQKYAKNVLLNPKKQTGIGHKSHLRFYMVMRQDKLTQEIDYHLLSDSLVFLAAEPYSKCLVAFKEGKFDPVSSGYCNQSNLTKDKQYFKDHREHLPGFRHAHHSGEAIVEESVTETSSGVIEQSERILIHKGDEGDEDESLGKTIKNEKEIEHIAVQALSQKADIAFDQRFGKGFYENHILPQLKNIGKLLSKIVSDQNVSMDRCANASSRTYLGCSQILAIDVLFTDGSEPGAKGIPRGWLLEANTRPGLAGPSAHNLTKNLFEDLLPYLIDPTIQKIQQDLEKVQRTIEIHKSSEGESDSDSDSLSDTISKTYSETSSDEE